MTHLQVQEYEATRYPEGETGPHQQFAEAPWIKIRQHLILPCGW